MTAARQQPRQRQRQRQPRKTQALVYETLCRLDAANPGELVGPKDIADELKRLDPESRANTSLVCTHLKSLVEQQLVERVSLGKTRGLYRLLHDLPSPNEEEE